MKRFRVTVPAYHGAPRRLAGAVCAAAILLTLLAASPLGAQTGDEPPPVPYAARPYRVLVTVAFDSSPEFTPQFRAQTLERLRSVTERTFGPVWQAEITRDAELFPATAAGLDRLTAESVEPEPDASPFDKRYILAIEASEGTWRVSAREWDRAARLLGGTRTFDCPDRRALAETAGRALAGSFRPTLEIERIDRDRVSLALRAGVFSLPDSGGVQLAPGEYLVPYYRYLDRDGTVRRIQFLPFTWLVVDEVAGHRVQATVVSGVRGALGTGRRRQVELGAIVVRPHLASTRLKLVPRTNSDRPLAAHRVALFKKRLVRDEAIEPPVELLTDRAGEINVPLDPAHPLVWAYVWSGQALLARIPLVPGAESAVVAELPDDSARLRLEGELAILEADLIDAVALRAVILARMRTLGDAEDWQAYDKAAAELDRLPRRAEFDSRLNIARQNALQAARAQNSRVLELRVNRQCDRLRNMIARYLDLEPVRQLREEMQQRRRGG